MDYGETSQATTVDAVASEIARALGPLAKRYGVVAKVEFRGPQRAIRSGAPFRPDKHSVCISFEAVTQSAPREISGNAPVRGEPASAASSRLCDSTSEILIHALNRAEHTPGHTFVAIKWFRDQALAREGMTRPEADAALSNAIAQGLVLTAKINNPKNPTFQTTTVRLNQSDPRVTKTLANAMPRRHGPIAASFSLSEVILQERR